MNNIQLPMPLRFRFLWNFMSFNFVLFSAALTFARQMNFCTGLIQNRMTK